MSESPDPRTPPTPDPATPAARPRRRRFRTAISVTLWLYLAILLAVWIALRFASDRWWPATLILFGPRWVFTLPLPFLVLPVLFLHRRALPLLALTAWVALVPVMDFCLPWRTLLPGGGGGGGGGDRAPSTLRVLSCNVDRSALRAADLAALIATARPDVVALQEWSAAHEAVLFANGGQGGWHTRRDGELFLASRYPFRAAEDVGVAWRKRFAGAAVRYEIDTPAGVVDFYNLHLNSPHNSFNAVLGREGHAPALVQRNSDERLIQLQDLAASIARRPGPILLAGDFNTPGDSTIFRDNLAPVRDAFATAGLGYGRTYQVRWTQTRIDHVLATPHLRPLRCTVGRDVGSAHRPVLADFAWTTPPN